MVPPDRAPYPGLRSFTREETDLFFGRDGCVEHMLGRLASTRFLAVLGSSGTGKSSLVETGLLSALDMGLLPGAGARWRVVDFRPAGAPLRNLARRLLEVERAETEQAGVQVDDVAIDLLRTRLKREPGAIVNWCREGHLPRRTNLLILVDQFEELFRYDSHAGRDEAEAFVARLLEVKDVPGSRSQAAAETPLYVAITMRSEYLGACALIAGLAEAVNAGTYLTPRMTRDECREAIKGPAQVCGIEIEERLVNRLLNDLADFAAWDEGGADTRPEVPGRQDQLSRLARRADQLPLLQHALNRMWEEARAREGPVKLTLADYERIGGLQGALDKHADQVLDQLERRLGKACGRAITEMVFRAVTAGTSAADAVRCPTPFGTLVRMCGDEAAVRAVVDAFRASGCNFLTPGPDVPLREDTYVDISHESLIRQWSRLSAWLVQEARASQAWHRLTDAAASYRRGEGGLLKGRNLDTLVAWRNESKPNAIWAARYGGDYAEAVGFLNESVRRRRIGRAVTTALAVVVFTVVGFLTFRASQKEAEERLAEAAREKIEKNVQQTAEFALGEVAATVQDYQRQGRWSDAWNVLAQVLGEVERSPDVLGEFAARTVHWRALEQHFRAMPEIAKALQDQKLDDEAVQELATRPEGRFGLLGSNSRLYVFDRLSGAIVARSDELERSLRRPRYALSDYSPRATAVKSAEGETSVFYRYYPFLSADGKNAVVVLKNGYVVHWDVAGGTLTPVLFARDQSASAGLTGGDNVASIAFEARSRRVALLLKPDERRDARIVVSNSPGGEPGYAKDLTSVINALGEFGLPASCRKRVNRAAVDLFDATLLGFVGDRLLLRLSDKTPPDAIIAVDTKIGEVAEILVWPNLYRAPALAPDEQVIVTTADWDPHKPCNFVSGDLDVRPGKEGAHYTPGGYLIAADVASGRVSLTTPVPAGSDVKSIVAIPAGAQGMRKYSVVLNAGGAYRQIILESGEGGGYAVSYPAMPEVASRQLADRSPVESTWPLPMAISSWPITSITARIFASVSEPRDEGQAAQLTVTRYRDGESTVGPLRAALTSEVQSIPLDSAGLKLNSSELRGAFDADGSHLLLTTNETESAAPTSEEGAAKPSSQQPYAVFLDLRRPSGKWAEIAVRGCAQTHRVSFRDIRYWGTQDYEHSGRPWPIFIGIEGNHIWKIYVSPDETNPRIGADCIGTLNGEPVLLAVDGVQGRAAVQSDSIYIYSLPSSEGRASGDFWRANLDPLLTPVVAGAFVGDGKLALATGDGDIWLAEKGGPIGEWTTKPLLKGVTSTVGLLAADENELLVVAENGYALALAFDNGSVHPVAFGNLPKTEEVYQLSFNASRQSVDVILSDILESYQLSAAVPADRLLGEMAASRGFIAPSERKWADLLHRLAGGDSRGAAGVADLFPLDTASKCQLAIKALLALEEATFRDSLPPLAQVRNSERRVRENCPEAKPAKTGHPDLGSAKVILDVIDGLGRTKTSWPREWSLLVQASERGDQLALRSLLIALKWSDNDRIRRIAQSIWDRMASSGDFVAGGKIATYSAGRPVEEPMGPRLATQEAAADPDVHLLLGRWIVAHESDQAALSRALFHFWIAEELYRASGRLHSEVAASVARAMVARALPDDAVRAVRGRIAAWRAQPPSADESASASASEPAAADDETGRLAKDIADLGSIAKSTSDPRLFAGLRAVLLWSLGERQEAADGSLARRSYGDAVALLDDIPAGDLDIDQLTAWSKKLGQLGENGLAGRVLIKALMTFKDGIRDENDLRRYGQIVSSLRARLESDEPSLETALKSLRFSPYLFRYVSVGRNSPQLRAVARDSLKETLTLLTALPSANDDLNWVVQRGVTAFWLGVTAWDEAVQAKDQSDASKALRLEYFNTAIATFRDAEKSAGADPDLSFLLAEALRWRGANLSGQEKIDDLSEASRQYGLAVSAFENARKWKPPVNTTTAELYTTYADVVRMLSRKPHMLLEAKTDQWNPEDQEILNMYWDGLRSARLWETLRQKSRVAQDSDWGDVHNVGFGYALASLGGHIRLNDASQRGSDNECDHLASSMIDPMRRSGSILWTQIDVEKAKAECSNALQASHNDVHYVYLLSRAQASPKLAIDAALGGYAAGFNEIVYLIEQRDKYKKEVADGRLHRLCDRLIRAYNQRVLFAAFPNVYEFLKGRIRDESEREALKWLAARAADVGVPEGHAALADFSDSDAEKWIHLRLAARLMAIRKQDGSAFKARADAIHLPEAEVGRAERAVRFWTVLDPLVDLSGETLNEVREAFN